MNFTIVFLWTAAAIAFGWTKLISIDALFLGFSIMMAAQYLHFGKGDE